MAVPDPTHLPNEFGRLRVWYPTVGSTMDVAAELGAAGAPHGTVVEAGYQSSGRGRMGRAWEAPPGSALLTSWILRADTSVGHAAVLSPLIALAVVRAIEALIPGTTAGYKWPNDVLVDGRKVAGILLASRVLAADAVLIAGIGVNLDEPREGMATGRAGLREWRSDLASDAAREQIASELDRAWQRFLEKGALVDDDRAQLEHRLRWRGQQVEIQLPDRDVSGRILGLEHDGALRLRRTDDDRVVALRVGEIQRGPREVAVGSPEPCRILPGANRAASACPPDRERH